MPALTTGRRALSPLASVSCYVFCFLWHHPRVFEKAFLFTTSTRGLSSLLLLWRGSTPGGVRGRVCCIGAPGRRSAMVRMRLLCVLPCGWAPRHFRFLFRFFFHVFFMFYFIKSDFACSVLLRAAGICVISSQSYSF